MKSSDALFANGAAKCIDAVPAAWSVETCGQSGIHSNGTLKLECFRAALLNFYPLVAQFPSYMALALAKATQFNEAGVVPTRDWLIQNIKVEERHLTWYRDWAGGFGLTVDQLDRVTPPPAMNAVNHYLWSINHRGSLAECLAATNLAIE